ncbi:ABC transporter substrate-binding protein [Jiella sp. M17.18]|uniref:ABC transporter substrate-binding protein n=1 Tax=Jiella sp. M17.18 TaxID=3234247 RepID=UPI0034DF6479
MKNVIRSALAAALLLGASQAALAIERGGILHYGRYADSLFLDPVLNDANVDIWILSNLYDTLILPTDDGKGLKPGLATKWKVADDGLSVDLTLRDGIEFSDGSKITPADVVWSLKRAADPKNGIWNFLLESVKDVVANGDNGVTIKLKHPDPTILAALTVFNSAIMPEKQFEAAPGKTDADKAKAFAEHPVGSGPFVLKSWQRGSTMELVKNEHYWAKGEDGKPLPYLDGVTFELLPDDATRILKLQSGEIDGAELIPYARVAELKQADGIDMELFPSTRVADIIMNVRPKVGGKDNPLSNPKVRQALNYAANKQAIIGIVTHGVGTPMSSYMSSATPLHVGKGAVYPYDLAKAKELMKEAGFENGFSTSILVLAGSQDEIGTATALQQMWSQIGVKLELQQVDNATRTQKYRDGDFDMRAGAWTDDIADPNEITSYYVYSPNIQAVHSGWKSDEADKLFEQSQREIDHKKRAEEYARIQEIYNSSGPTIPLYETPYPVALSKKVHGFLQIPLGNNIFRATWIDKK